MLTLQRAGLYCAAGDFYVDPWLRAERAVITHAHGDHARSGSSAYLAARGSEHVLRQRLGDVSLDILDYGEVRRLRDAEVSLHPAGHVLGSAQVRIAGGGEVWTVSGDYKLERDPTCAPFEPLRCDVFVSETTSAAPAASPGARPAVIRQTPDLRNHAARGRTSAC